MKKVRVIVEAKEMVHGVEVESRQDENLRAKHRHGDRGKFHSFYTGGALGSGKETKPPCGFWEDNHGVWSCKRFQGLDVLERWNVAKNRRLCFRCLESFHQGTVCPRSKPCNINGCAKNHHNLLHDTKMDGKQPEEKVAEPKESDKHLPTFPGEGAVGSQTKIMRTRSNIITLNKRLCINIS